MGERGYSHRLLVRQTNYLLSFVPSTTDWAFAVKPPNIKANKIIDFLIFISFKCNVLPAKSLEMYCLFMSNFLVHFLIRYSL